MKGNFSTQDVYLAAFIALQTNFNPKLEISGRRVLFTFPSSDDVYKACTTYNQGPFAEYAETVKVLRGKMYAKKEEMKGERTDTLKTQH